MGIGKEVAHQPKGGPAPKEMDSAGVILPIILGMRGYGLAMVTTLSRD